MAGVPKSYVSPVDYLAAERCSPTKSEYLRGEVFAMTGASREHNLIAVAVSSALHQQLLTRPCEVYQGDMRVKVSPTGFYTYPDVVVACDNPKFEDEHVDTLLNPTVIVEVFSESTAEFDRGAKFVYYRGIESLCECVLIAQDKRHVERFTRQSDSTWLLWETNDPQSTVELTSIACQLRVSDIYAKITFADQDS